MGALLVFLVSFSSFAQAYIENAKTPLCFRGSDILSINNNEALGWKSTTQNQYKSQGYIAGVLDGQIKLVGDHYRFILRIGNGPRDLIEVVYNENFGSIPKVETGAQISVCGEFINSFKATGRYQASPAGAIIHWAHYNPGTRAGSANHEHGFIMIEGSTLVGFDDAKPAAWDGEISGFKPGQR